MSGAEPNKRDLQKSIMRQSALQEIKEIVGSFIPQEPYISNALNRIQDIVERVKKDTYVRRRVG